MLLEVIGVLRRPRFWELLERASLRCGCGCAWLSMGNQQLTWTTIIIIMDQAQDARVN